MRPLSVPAVSSMIALMSVGLPEDTASSMAARSWSRVSARTPLPPNASIISSYFASFTNTVGATSVPRGTRVTVQGTVKPAKRYALLLVYRLTPSGTTRRVGRQVAKVRRGRGASSFRFTKAGRYVLRFAVPPDAKNVGGRSKAIRINVR